MFVIYNEIENVMEIYSRNEKVVEKARPVNQGDMVLEKNNGGVIQSLQYFIFHHFSLWYLLYQSIRMNYRFTLEKTSYSCFFIN